MLLPVIDHLYTGDKNRRQWLVWFHPLFFRVPWHIHPILKAPCHRQMRHLHFELRLSPHPTGIYCQNCSRIISVVLHSMVRIIVHAKMNCLLHLNITIELILLEPGVSSKCPNNVICDCIFIT